MRRFFKSQFLWQGKARIRFGVPLILTTFIMISMVVVILSNTYQLEQHLEQYAETYSDDVSKQLAARIAFQLQQRAHDVQHLAESFSHMPEEVLTESLLKQKESNLEISHLFILNEDGTTFPEKGKIEGLEEYLENEEGIREKTHISFLGENRVIYSTPFYKNGSLRLLMTVYTGRVLQEMLEDFNYEEEGRCCIADKNGNVIISPSDMAPFHKLKKVIQGDHLSAEQNQTRETMLKNIQQDISGWTVFDDIEDHDLILGYDFLGVCDWILFSVLPLDLLSDTVRAHTIKFILIALVLILVTIGLVILIIGIYLKNMQRIKEAALTDPLTDGDNDTAFRMRGEYRLREDAEQVRTIVYLNNKDFRSYNTRFGVKGANDILNRIYQIIQQQLRDRELVSRCDGTSFCLLLNCNDEAIITRRLEKLSKEIRQQLHNVYGIDNHTITMGAYLIPAKPYDFIHMMDWAKIAGSYQTEAECCKIFDDSIVKMIRRENQLDGEFEKAIENHEFKLYIQPKVSPKSNQLLGGEVLVRWEHPEFGLVPPNEFIPLFEKNGKICALDFYMFEETCKLLREWIRRGTAIPLSVNLSRAHLGSHNFKFLNDFHRIKEEYQIPDKLIELELTESIILERQEISFVLEVIDRIQEMGFACSLDDFGFGYSCLTLLKDLNVNTVKLDRQFFINENEKAWIVIGEMIRMAHQLHVSVVAEGIEDMEQVEKLKACDCDLIQGFVYARPMYLSDFEKWAHDFK